MATMEILMIAALAYFVIGVFVYMFIMLMVNDDNEYLVDKRIVIRTSALWVLALCVVVIMYIEYLLKKYIK